METMKSKRIRRLRSSRAFRFLALAGVAALGAAMLGDVLEGRGVAFASERRHQDLLTTYTLLDSSLSDESSLKWLLLMRELTLNKPPKEVAKLMEKISKISKERAAELEKLRKLSPSVVGEPVPSPIGDAIQASAKAAGSHEMIFPDGSFNIRFLFLQAQATRMISVIAQETAKIEQNEIRRKWLKKLADEYEGLRNQLVASVKSCTPR